MIAHIRYILTVRSISTELCPKNKGILNNYILLDTCHEGSIKIIIIVGTVSTEIVSVNSELPF